MVNRMQVMSIFSPEPMVRSTPHLEILVLVSIPECVQIWLIPDVDDHSIDHLVALHIRNDII